MKSEHFNWDQGDNYLERTKGKNECVISAKFTLMSYLFECCYDLLFSKKHNASNSPGFKSVTGQHMAPKKCYLDLLIRDKFKFKWFT